MKKISLLVFMIVLSFTLMAQDNKEEKKAAKKAKKEKKVEEALESSEKLKSLFEIKQFVLEANTVYDKMGASLMLDPNLNFVGCDGKNSTIQLGFNQLAGWNGVGGVTLDGEIKKMEVTGKEGVPYFTVHATVQNKGGSVVTMIFSVSSNRTARVDMSGSFGEKLSFQGNVVPLGETTVYKGTPVF